jgi:metal-responsive CopG/Arc/MetJ family transcriptional regulator
MAIIKTSMRLDRELLDEAVELFGAKSRSEAIDILLREFVAANKPTKRSTSKIESPKPPA